MLKGYSASFFRSLYIAEAEGRAACADMSPAGGDTDDGCGRADVTDLEEGTFRDSCSSIVK